jgi:hypothetical protein
MYISFGFLSSAGKKNSTLVCEKQSISCSADTLF